MFGRSKPPASNSDRLAARIQRIGGQAPTPVATTAQLKEKTPRAPREATFKNATLLLDSGHRMTVALKDLSDAGARIEFFGRDRLPAEFVLAEPLLHLRRRVRIVWQRQGAAGVQFID